MNSNERKENRYIRRKAKRESNAAKEDKTFDEVFNVENLWTIGKECCNNVRWKSSVINFETNLLVRACKALENLQNNTRKFNGFHSFITIEHGKRRDIDAPNIDDRMIQKCFCRKLLTKIYSRTFVKYNSASLVGRGMHYALDGFTKHLRKHYRKYGLNGYIFQFDFKSYFASIPHNKLKERARKYIKDNKLYNLLCDFIDEFIYLKNNDPNDRFKGIGLGSEVSQLLALDYASPIDHFIKDQCGIKGYGRYNDDGYIICKDKDEVKYVIDGLTSIANELEIKLSPKKCKVTPIKNHCFTFLKMRYRLTNKGKVIMKLSKKSIKRVRKKIKKFRKLVNNGKMSMENVFTSYQSWRGYASKCDSYNTVLNMDKLFVKLFFLELYNLAREFKSHLGCITINYDKFIYYDKKTKEIIVPDNLEELRSLADVL